MDLGSTGIRQRKGITQLVEELDIFEKVVENVKEEKKVSSGLISFICFALMTCLFISETYSYLFTRNYDYRFTVDTEMDAMPTLDIDMIVATPCSSLQVLNSVETVHPMFGGAPPSLKRDPTRFEFTDEEQMYWTVLRHAHAEVNRIGLRGLDHLEYVDDSVESNLESLADQKQKSEAEHILEVRKQREKDNKPSRNGHVMFLVGNGLGMFQLVSQNEKGDDGTACRIHGKFKVRKGGEEKVVITMNNPMMMFEEMGGVSSGNISHRIEKFNFGPRIPGLVTPLAGAEHISESGQDVYRYFIKIVPTKIFGYFSYTMAYQYSVTFLKKKLKSGEHSHGGILLEYEFNANVIEVRNASTNFFTYIIRLCSIVGGVYATSTIINNLVQFVLSFLYPQDERLRSVHNQSRSHLSTDSHTSLIMDANIRVH